MNDVTKGNNGNLGKVPPHPSLFSTCQCISSASPIPPGPHTLQPSSASSVYDNLTRLSLNLVFVFFFFQMPLPPLLKAVSFSLHLLLFIHLPQRLLLHDAFQFLQTASPSLQQPPPPPPFSWLYLISCSCSWKSK